MDRLPGHENRSSDLRVRHLAGRDIGSLLTLWNRSVPSDPINRERLESRILLDSNVGREGLLIAERGSRVAGFAVVVAPRFALPREALDENSCFVVMFGVAPEERRRGVGTALFDHLETSAARMGRSGVVISSYPAGYIIPGVDKNAHSDALAFLGARGYRQDGEDCLAMDAPLASFTLPREIEEKGKRLSEENIIIREYERSDILDLMEFMAEYMPPDWTENYARRNLRALAAGSFREDQLMLALHEKKIVGFCQYEGEHFGPFGIVDEYQGRGIGGVLLSRTLEKMRQNDAHSAWVLWTGERAARGVYARLGFSVTRRFAIMTKSLT